MANTKFGTERLVISHKEVQRLSPSNLTIFDLPGEIRNEIYRLALDKEYQRVPLNPMYRNKPDPFSALLRTCSRMYEEARSYMTEKQTAYIPVLPDMDWTYGKNAINYGVQQETKDTVVCALTDFMTVHFHLHLDLLRKEDYDPDALLSSLARAIEIYQLHSSELFIKHNLEPRRATIHLDHLLSLWPKLRRYHQSYLPIGSLQCLVNLIAKDKTTEWQIRYYVATGQAGRRSTYAHCGHSRAIRDTELSQLKYFASQHKNINVVAEIYGDDRAWEYGDGTGCVSRTRTPVTEFWPNLHFDARIYRIVTYDLYKMENHPGKSTRGMCSCDVLKEL